MSLGRVTQCLSGCPPEGGPGGVFLLPPQMRPAPCRPIARLPSLGLLSLAEPHYCTSPRINGGMILSPGGLGVLAGEGS